MPMQRYCRLYIIRDTAHVRTNPIRDIPNIDQMDNLALAQPENRDEFFPVSEIRENNVPPKCQ